MNQSANAAATVVNAASKAQNFANQTVENGRFEVIKEPLGFIKIVQFFMAILAFAIAVNGSSAIEFTMKCPDPLRAEPIIYESKYSYPYDLTKAEIKIKDAKGCDPTPNLDFTHLTREGYNIKSSAEFFVFLGVMAFLYSLTMIIIYVFLKHKYDNVIYLPLFDFIVTVLFAICWFASDIAWAKAISDIQYHTNTENVISMLENSCKTEGSSSSNECKSRKYATYGSIIISCIIGFCNLILWSGNVWFVLKETTWYKTRKTLQAQQQNITNNPISSSGSQPNTAHAQFSNINDKI